MKPTKNNNPLWDDPDDITESASSSNHVWHNKAYGIEDQHEVLLIMQ